MKVAGEVYGRGPLIAAMPDVKTLNKTVELVLKNAALAAFSSAANACTAFLL